MNLLKYLISLIAVSVAFTYKFYHDLLPVYITVSLISMLYSYYWDLKHDWGFFEPGSRYPLLRSKLSYGNPIFYYFIIVANLLLRSAWIISITHPGSNHVTIFFVSLL